MNYTGYISVKFLTELAVAAVLYVWPYKRRTHFWGRLLLSLALCYVCAYFLIIRKLQRQDAIRLKANDTFFINILIVVSLIVLSVFAGDLAPISVLGEIAFVGYGIICGVFLLSLQISIFKRGVMERENEQAENRCVDDLVVEGGLPKTTKQDKSRHGYGLKSIRATAEKYGGSVTVQVKDGWFTLGILIPLPAEAPET